MPSAIVRRRNAQCRVSAWNRYSGSSPSENTAGSATSSNSKLPVPIRSLRARRSTIRIASRTPNNKVAFTASFTLLSMMAARQDTYRETAAP